MSSQNAIQVFRDNIAYIEVYSNYVPDIVGAFGVDLEDIKPTQLHAAFTHQIYFRQVIAATKIYSEYEFVPGSSKNVTYIHPLKIWAAPKNPEVLDCPDYTSRTIIEHGVQITVISNSKNWSIPAQLKACLARSNVTYLKITGPVTIIQNEPEQDESDSSYDEFYPDPEELSPEARRAIEAEEELLELW